MSRRSAVGRRSRGSGPDRLLPRRATLATTHSALVRRRLAPRGFRRREAHGSEGWRRMGIGLGLGALFGAALGLRTGGTSILLHAVGVPAGLLAAAGIAVPAFAIVLGLADAPIDARSLAAATTRAVAKAGLVLGGLAPAAALYVVTVEDALTVSIVGFGGLLLAGLIASASFAGDPRTEYHRVGQDGDARRDGGGDARLPRLRRDPRAPRLVAHAPAARRWPMSAALLGRILRSPGEVARACRDENDVRAMAANALLVAIVVGSVLFGLAVGSWHGPEQALFAGMKMPIVTVGTLAVCAPAFYAISAVFGRAWSARTVLSLMLVAGARFALGCSWRRRRCCGSPSTSPGQHTTRRSSPPLALAYALAGLRRAHSDAARPRRRAGEADHAGALRRRLPHRGGSGGVGAPAVTGEPGRRHRGALHARTRRRDGLPGLEERRAPAHRRFRRGDAMRGVRTSWSSTALRGTGLRGGDLPPGKGQRRERRLGGRGGGFRQAPLGAVRARAVESRPCRGGAPEAGRDDSAASGVGSGGQVSVE